MTVSPSLPDCWGHRGASARFPENTLASFEAAIRDGAEGIESDVHLSKDNVIVMFHDPELSRTTDSIGKIRDRDWYGPEGMEHVRTKKEPKQSIPTFPETIALLMQPENMHCQLNIDVKPQNDPTKLFELMHAVISSYEGYEESLAPRILLGLWHTSFLEPAKSVLPNLRRSYIGRNIETARTFFWKDCEVFSINFGSLTHSDGAKFREDCKAAGKKLMVWTVNEPDHMLEAVRWEVDIIITDHTRRWLELREALRADYDTLSSKHTRTFLWTSWWLYSPVIGLTCRLEKFYLEKVAGPFQTQVVTVHG